ncbi:NAD-dependent epimerase/dehydratase family protein [Actinomadura rugatobispora]|uniref:NAD-dependent epimerase/dehydratase family protein n=1 Tax=Actinomadura rugatobispora TaxID=1994 RepID=A0ABW1ACC7_9ACTN|nr:NAD-dependent epimerase/dehydratase family protein [Actinomadura rugatobispora]
MARAVVTGGCGFVGAHLAEALVERGDDVTIVDNVPPPGHLGRLREDAAFVQADMRDPEALAHAIRPGVDVVYHMASVVGVDRYLSRPLDVIDINCGGTRNVLDLVARTGAAVLVASTSEVFGKNPAVPWPEDGDRVLGPTSADRWTYSTSKAMAEHMTYAFAGQHGVAATIVRYFNVYGPRQRPAYVLSRSIHRALNGVAPVVYDGGSQTRCFTYVEDAVQGTLAAVASPEGGAFNIGSMDEMTVAEAVRAVAELTGHAAPPSPVDTRVALGDAYEDLMRRMPDTTRAARVLGWKCHTSFRDGLAKTIEWARRNPWWLDLSDSGAS